MLLNFFRKILIISLLSLIFSTKALALDIKNSRAVVRAFPWPDGYVVKEILMNDCCIEFRQLLIERNGEAVIAPQDGYIGVGIEPLENFPVTGCRTLQVITIAGGSGYCVEVYFLSKCKQSTTTITHFDVSNTDIVDYRGKEFNFDANGDGIKEILLIDSHKSSPSFPTFGSSYFKQKEYFVRVYWDRLGVFDIRNHSWRVDKRGEYTAFYENLFSKCQKQDEPFSCSYFLYMMGKPKNQVIHYVHEWVVNRYRGSPEIREYLRSADNIIKFVLDSADKFNPFYRNK